MASSPRSDVAAPLKTCEFRPPLSVPLCGSAADIIKGQRLPRQRFSDSNAQWPLHCGRLSLARGLNPFFVRASVSTARVSRPTPTPACRNPFFVRASVSTHERMLTGVWLYVVIPSSSGQVFQPTRGPRLSREESVVIPSSSGQVFQQNRGKHPLPVRSVVIPSSSGQVFQPFGCTESKRRSRSRNPFFVRASVSTPAEATVADLIADCRNPFFVRASVSTAPGASTTRPTATAS